MKRRRRRERSLDALHHLARPIFQLGPRHEQHAPAQCGQLTHAATIALEGPAPSCQRYPSASIARPNSGYAKSSNAVKPSLVTGNWHAGSGSPLLFSSCRSRLSKTLPGRPRSASLSSTSLLSNAVPSRPRAERVCNLSMKSRRGMPRRIALSRHTSMSRTGSVPARSMIVRGIVVIGRPLSDVTSHCGRVDVRCTTTSGAGALRLLVVATCHSTGSSSARPMMCPAVWCDRTPRSHAQRATAHVRCIHVWGAPQLR